MNKEVARKRYMDVIRPDVMHNSQGDFLATHVPMKKLYITEHLTDHAEVPEQDKKYPKTEEEVYDQFMTEREEDRADALERIERTLKELGYQLSDTLRISYLSMLQRKQFAKGGEKWNFRK